MYPLPGSPTENFRGATNGRHVTMSRDWQSEELPPRRHDRRRSTSGYCSPGTILMGSRLELGRQCNKIVRDRTEVTWR
jgi:hypothetical protein